MKYFDMKYFDWRKRKKAELHDNRMEHERFLRGEYEDANINLTGIFEKALIIVVLLKSKLSNVTPVEGKVCYSFLWDCLSSLCGSINRFIDDHMPPFRPMFRS